MNENIKVGERLEIHCYKHNGRLHRQWDEAVVLDIHDDYIVFGNNRYFFCTYSFWNYFVPRIFRRRKAISFCRIN